MVDVDESFDDVVGTTIELLDGRALEVITDVEP